MALFVAGCTNVVRVPGDKGILTLHGAVGVSRFLESIGYPDNLTGSVSRSRSGDLLFIEFLHPPSFTDPGRVYQVAVVSSDGVTVRQLPGRSRLNDEAEVAFWYDDRERNLRFAEQSLPQAIHTWKFISDGHFVALQDGIDIWVARVESPLEKLIVAPQTIWVDRIASSGNKLHIFGRGKPEGGRRKDGWPILKHYEYELNGDDVRLLRIQDFDFTWTILDFDPHTGLAFVSSWSDMFAHGILVDVNSGSRKNVRFGHGRGYILDDGVIEVFKKVEAGEIGLTTSEAKGASK